MLRVVLRVVLTRHKLVQLYAVQEVVALKMFDEILYLRSKKFTRVLIGIKPDHVRVALVQPKLECLR